MFVIELGNYIELPRYERIFKLSNQSTIAICKNTYSEYPLYCDIFSDGQFYLFGDTLHLSSGQQCCDNPVPILQILKKLSRSDEFKEMEERALLTGRLPKKDLIKIYNTLNVATSVKTTKQSSNSPAKPPKHEEMEYKEKKQENLSLGKILNEEKYLTEPAIGREEELKRIMVALASLKKSPILLGQPGVGKSAIVDELVYKIQRNDVPNFLKNQTILEIDSSSIVAGTQYRGEFEEKFEKLIYRAKQLKAILYIDEIRTIYGAGTSRKNDNDIAEMLKRAIDREHIRVIGATTEEEYQTYFSQDALKRRFQKVIITEPNEELLKRILWNVFQDYAKLNNISLDLVEDNLIAIIAILVKMTRKECRDCRDVVNNPDLAISIVDMAFADAKMSNSQSLTYDNLIYGIYTCTRICDSVRDKSIASLKRLQPLVRKRVDKKIVYFMPKK